MAHRGGDNPADPLHVADEYVVTDGGKPGLYKDLTKIFKEKVHDVRHTTVMYLRNGMMCIYICIYVYIYIYMYMYIYIYIYI